MDIRSDESVANSRRIVEEVIKKRNIGNNFQMTSKVSNISGFQKHSYCNEAFSSKIMHI